MKKKILVLTVAFTVTSAHAQWETVYFPTFSNLPWLNSVIFSDFNNGLTVGYSADTLVILKTTDNGTNWNKVFNSATGNPCSFYDVVYTNPMTAYAVGYSSNGGIVAKTIDSGNTWTTTNVSPSCVNSVSFPSLNYGYACGCNGSVIKTINAGTTWSTLSSPVTTTLESIVFVNDTVGFACGDSIVIKTTDGGLTWNVFTVPTTGWGWSHLSFPSPSIGYLLISYLGNANNLYKTTNQGANWNFITAINSSTLYTPSIYFPNDTVGYICGQFQMNKTTDGGTTWNSQTANPPGWSNFFDDLMDVYFLNQDTGFAVGNNQYYRTVLGGLQSIKYINSNSLISIYPNPAMNELNIKVNFETQQMASENYIVSIINLFGQEIFKKDFIKQLKIDVSRFPKGLYLVESCTSEGEVCHTEKILIE